MLKHTDTKGLSTQYRYNAAGLLEQRIDANRHQIGYQWDNQGRIQKLINQNHAEYLFSYNRLGQLVHEQAFDGEEKHYSYNENGQLFQIRQPNVFTQFAYFADGMIASKTYTHVQTRHSQTEEFEYNLNNQLSKAKNKESQSDFYRNALGQLVREHQHYKVPNLSPMTAVLRYEYDELGNLSKTIRPDGQVQSNLSYGSGHIYGIAFNQQDMVAFQRDDLHRETARMLANGLIQSKNYNDVGLLSSQIIRPEQETAGRVQHRAERHYQYDQNYLLTQVNDSRLGRLTYQYDAIGRLTQSQSQHQTESFAFDPAGNLIDPIAMPASQVKSNLIAQYKGKNYKYDAQGNVVETSHAGKTLKLTWDNLNRLIRSDHQGQVTEYGYDVFGRRLFKKNPNTQTLTLFGWDGDLMIWESQQSNTVDENYTKHYVYEPQSFVPLLQTGYTGFIKLLETPNYAQFQHEEYSVYKDPIWRTETRKNKVELERVAFYHCDQIGAPQTLSNELGECIWEIELNTWGTVSEIKASHNFIEQTNIRFQGQYYDVETDLHYNHYRYYDPLSAKYLSKDPIGLIGGMNNSVYVSDPNQWVDPMGLVADREIKKRLQQIEECRRTGQCEALFDYAYCSVAGGGAEGMVIINLYSGKVYGGAGLNIPSTLKDIHKEKTISKRLKSTVGGSCMLGKIFNGRGRNNTERTDRFINGQAVGISGGPWWKIGISTPMGEDFLTSLSTKTPFAIEVGLGTPGIDASFLEVFGDKEINPVKFLKQINKENEAMILEQKIKNLESQGKGWGTFTDEFGRLF